MPKQTSRSHTVDRGPPLSGAADSPLEVEALSANRSLLPDGSVLYRNVPIARSGWMQYAPGEVPVAAPKQPGASPVIYVHRGAEDLFAEDTLRSFVGCAITDQHPPVPVTPSNFAHLAKGFILRTWRGEGDDSDCLMADLIVKDHWAIQRIDNGDREVSCGYEASYVQTGDGQGKQTSIIGNHLALVDKGRCGPRCSIGDEDTLSTTDVNEETMTQQTQPPVKRARIPLAEARARVADAMAELEQAEGDQQQGVTVHVHLGGEQKTDPAATSTGALEVKTPTVDKAVEERFATIEKGQEELKGTLATILEAVKAGGQATAKTGDQVEEEDKTEATATMDSAALATGYQQFLAQAEILVPGFKLPTFDAAAKRHATVDRMCMGRRAVLSALSANAQGVALLSQANGGKEFDVIGSTCPEVAVTFKAAAAAKAAENNRQSTGDSSKLPTGQQTPTSPKKISFADINAANTKFWQTQGPRA